MLLRVTTFQYVLFVRSLEWFGLNTPSKSILTFRLLRSVRRLMTDEPAKTCWVPPSPIERQPPHTVTTSVVAGQQDLLIQRPGRDPDLLCFKRERPMNRYLAVSLVVFGMTGCTSVHYNESDCGTLPSDTFWSGNVALQCQEYRRLQAETAYRTEVKHILQSYRECVNKQEGSLADIKERCSVYALGLYDPSTGPHPSK